MPPSNTVPIMDYIPTQISMKVEMEFITLPSCTYNMADCVIETISGLRKTTLSHPRSTQRAPESARWIGLDSSFSVWQFSWVYNN